MFISCKNFNMVIVLHTTTNMDGRELISSVVRQLKNTVGVSDGHIYEKCLAMEA